MSDLSKNDKLKEVELKELLALFYLQKIISLTSTEQKRGKWKRIGSVYTSAYLLLCVLNVQQTKKTEAYYQTWQPKHTGYHDNKSKQWTDFFKYHKK